MSTTDRPRREYVMECPTRTCNYRTPVGTVYECQPDLDRHRRRVHDLPALDPRNR